MNPTEDKKGFIVMLDALGVRNMTMEQSKDFLSARDELINIIYKRARKKFISMNISSSLKIYAFGDTIIICLESEDFCTQINEFGFLLRIIFFASFEKDILWRGAISYGDYFCRDKDILGPAVYDAANWHEEADWMGLIATPACGIKMSEYAQKISKRDKFELYVKFIQYAAPLKMNGHKTLRWVQAWPAYYLIEQEVKLITQDECSDKAKEKLFKHLGKHFIPKGTEKKYQNTIDFFNWYCGEWSSIMKLSKQA